MLINCLIVGLDKLGNAPLILKAKGIKKIDHWDGRGKKLPDKLPKNTDIIVIYTQKVKHELVKRTKLLAEHVGKEPIFVRGTAELQQKLNNKVA